MMMMSDLFVLGLLKAPQLVTVFEDHVEAFLHHLAMLMTVSDYVKTNMPKLVETQAQ